MNKTLAALATVLMLGVSGAAMAKDHCPDCDMRKGGGFMGGENQISTVKDAMGMPDDTMVSLQGKIQKRLKKDKYQFQDNTGSIVVEIDKDVWRGQTVTPNDTIMIDGEIDKDDDRTIVDVERLMVK